MIAERCFSFRGAVVHQALDHLMTPLWGISSDEHNWGQGWRRCEDTIAIHASQMSVDEVGICHARLITPTD